MCTGPVIAQAECRYFICKPGSLEKAELGSSAIGPILKEENFRSSQVSTKIHYLVSKGFLEVEIP